MYPNPLESIWEVGMLMSTVMPVSVKTILLEASIEVIEKKAEEHDHSGMDTQIWARGSTCEDIWNGGTLLKGRKEDVNNGCWKDTQTQLTLIRNQPSGKKRKCKISSLENGDRVISDPLKLRQHITDSGQEFVWQVYFAQSLSIFRHRLRSDRSWRMSTWGEWPLPRLMGEPTRREIPEAKTEWIVLSLLFFTRNRVPPLLSRKASQSVNTDTL